VRVPSVEGSPLATIAVEPGGVGAPAPPGAALVALVAKPDWARAHLAADGSVIEKALLDALERLPEGRRRSSFVEIRVTRTPSRASTWSAIASSRGCACPDRAARRGRRLYFAWRSLARPDAQAARSASGPARR
jgi:hypothetical protein